MPKYSLYSKGDVELNHIVSDLNGTLAVDGHIIEGVSLRFNKLTQLGFQIHVVTGDINGDAKKLLEDYPCELHVVNMNNKFQSQAEQKLNFIEGLGKQSVIAFGNGANDESMLEAAAIGVCVCEAEGVSLMARDKSDILVNSINDGLDLLLYPKRIAGH